MARRVIAAFTASLMLSGCAHVHPSNPATGDVTLEDVNRALAGRTVLVSLSDATKLIADDVRLSAKSVSLRPRKLSQFRGTRATALSLSEVRTIAVTRRGRGALDGGIIGFVMGAVAGSVLGAVLPAPSHSGFDSADKITFGGFVGGVLGCGVGLVVGIGLGSTDVYDFVAAPAVRPPGGEQR